MFFVFCLAFEMDGDQRVMYDGWRKDGAHSNEWMVVTKAFLEHAFKDATGRLVKCPCKQVASEEGRNGETPLQKWVYAELPCMVLAWRVY
jgi:hypothetical protein